MKELQTNRFYDFGAFRLDAKKRRLLHGEEIISLTPKEFELLLMLVKNAGRVVEKDDLLDEIWKDSFVEEGTLTRNISWLRKKLASNGEKTIKFIETVPKRGYRFAAEVTTTDQPEVFIEETTLTRVSVEETLILQEEENKTTRVNAPESEIVSANPNSDSPARQIDKQKTFSFSPVFLFSSSKRLAALFAVIAAVSVGFIIYQNYFERTNQKINVARNIKPFSGAQGRENSVAFSPDSKQIVYSWNGGTRENSDIYVSILGAGEPVRLTDTETHEQYPVFSPDGKYIAFVRDFKTHGEIILIPALGGAERRIARLFSGNYSISFAPDGESIAAVDAADEGGKRHAIFMIDLKSGERRRLTPDGDFFGETTPRFSPDGKSLAFLRIFSDLTQDLYVVSTNSKNNEPIRLTTDRKTIHSLTWSADGSEIFFVSLRESNRPNIWRIASSGGAAELLSIGGKYTTNIAASPDGKIIAFIDNSLHSDIYSLKSGETLAKPLIATSYMEDTPDFSPDGRRFIFRSNRSGNAETWIADADGKNLRQVTGTQFQVGNARFSPAGTQIVFHAREGENKNIYIAQVDGGETRPLISDSAQNSFPSWSADGKFVYFASDRTGINQIWRVPSGGGNAVQITRGGGLEAIASLDGKYIYYVKDSPDVRG